MTLGIYTSVKRKKMRQNALPHFKAIDNVCTIF